MIRRLFLGLIAAVMVAGGSASGSAATIEVSVLSDQRVPVELEPMIDPSFSISIRGRIEPGDASTFERKLLEGLDSIDEAYEVNLWVWLDGPGGQAKDAIEIGRMIRAVSGSTIIEKDKPCYSSCALIFVAGVTRRNNGLFGAHRPYFVVQPDAISPSSSDVANLRKFTLEYLREMNVSDRLGTRLLDTPPQEMYLLRGNEILAYVPEVDPVYEDLRALREARRYGLDTASYFRLAKAASDLARHTCPKNEIFCDLYVKDELLWGLDTEEFKSRLGSVESRCLVSPREKTQVTARVKQQFAAAITQRSASYLEPANEHPSLKRHRDCVIDVMRGRL